MCRHAERLDAMRQQNTPQLNQQNDRDMLPSLPSGVLMLLLLPPPVLLFLLFSTAVAPAQFRDRVLGRQLCRLEGLGGLGLQAPPFRDASLSACKGWLKMSVECGCCSRAAEPQRDR